MSFTTNTSNLSGKSTTNAFDIVANSLTVNKNTLCKGDLTVLGTTNIGNVSLENGFVNNLTVNNFTATNPVPITSGGTGLATIGAPNQVLTVNNAGTALIYQAQGLINPATITGTTFTGNPTLSLGLEADTGSLGRGFIRTGVAAVNGLFLGTSSATVLRLWSNFATDSNAEIINTNANFTYNSTGSSGVFQVLSAGGGISFTNSGIGTISMATSAGNLSLAAGAGTISLTTGIGSTTITTGAGPISLTTGAGNISLTTAAAGIISITTATAGAINIGANVGLVNLYGSGITLGAPAIYIGGGNSVVPILSAVIFACGDVTGVTGFWNITTLAFQLNAVSISLNSTLTIALNNNTTIGGYLSASGNVLANSGHLADQSALNPTVTVYNFDGYRYGMDLGYNTTTLRYRTRIFCPNIGAGDIALSTSIRNATSQSNFTDRLVVRGDTGNIEMYSNVTVTNGNIITNQNIVGGVEIINNGNLALTSASPGNILIRGGSGSIITLPDATTLVVGYVYTINNNSNNPTIVNQHNSGTVGTIPALNAGTVTCISTTSPNGQWDIHITGPTAGTDWATPGQIGSAIPNTGAFTSLTTTLNTSIGGYLRVYGDIPTVSAGNGVCMGLQTDGYATITLNGTGANSGYIDFSQSGTDFNCRIMGKTSKELEFSADTYTFLNQAQNTTFLLLNSTFTANVRGTTGILGSCFVNSGNDALSVSLNPALTVYNNSGYKYGMDLGYNATSSRYRTRIFCPNVGGGDISLSTSQLNATSQSDFSDRLIVRGDTGAVEINGDTTISSTTTIISGQTTSITGTSVALNAPIFQVTNQSSTIIANLASFLEPTLGVIGVSLETVNLTFGKSHTTNNAAQLQFGYQLSSPPFNNPITVWGFYNLTGTNIKLQQNPPVGQNAVTVTGNTQIVGDLSLTGTVTIKNSSALYVQTTNFLISPNVWTDVQAIAFSRGSGANQLTPTFISGIFTGFVNNTSFTLQTSISFSCRRSDTNSGGENSLRISYGTENDYIAEQYFEGLQAGTVSANFNLLPSERLRCLIFPVAVVSVEYGSVRITINTTPIV